MTFSRRPGVRFNRGRIAVSSGSSAPPNPAQIITDGTLKIWLQGNLGATTSTSAFDALANQADVAVLASLTQGTSARRPKVSTIRGKQGLFHVSASQLWMSGAITGSFASSGTGFTVYTASRSSGTGTLTRSATTGNLTFLQTTGATWPRNIVMAGATARTASGVITEDEVYSQEAFFNQGSSLQYKNGVVQGAASTAGTNAYTGSLFWGSSATPSAYITGQEFMYVMVTRALTAGERTAMEAWVSYCIDHTGTQRGVLPLGDSLTQGVNSTDGDGWRSLLATYLDSNKLGGKWLFQNGDVRDLAFPQDKHHGVSGDPIANTQTAVNSIMGVGAAYNIPIVCLMIGTNDCRNNGAVYVSGTGPGTTIQAYQDLVTSIDTKITAATGTHPRIVVTTVPACNTAQATALANIQDYNSNLVNVAWPALSGAGIQLHTWDAYTVVGPWSATTFGADQFHMNDTGYALYLQGLLTPLAAAAAAA